MNMVIAGKTAGGLACCSELGDGLVQVRVGVEVAAPQVFTVGGICAACVALLGAVVQDRDATGKDDEG